VRDGAESRTTEPARAGPADAIDAWLTIFARLLHWPARDAQAVRDELEAHLRERARDLMLEGCAESDAFRAAIAELGEAAVLAQRYRSAHGYTLRRFLMNASVFVLAGAALGLSIVAISGGATPSPAGSPARPESGSEVARESAPSQPECRPIRISVFAPSQEESAAAQTPITGDYRNTPLRQVFDSIGATLKLTAAVQWPRLEEEGISPDTVLGITVRDTPMATLFWLISQSLGSSTLAYRTGDRFFEVSTRDDFDRRERTLVCYDLSNLDSDISADDVVELLQTFVEPEGWKNSGGELGEIRIAGRRMFVQAPKRYHRQIEWFLGELTVPPPEEHADASGSSSTLLTGLARARWANLALDLRPVIRDNLVALDVRPVTTELAWTSLAARNLALASPCPPEEVEPGQTKVYHLKQTPATGIADILQRLVACEHPDGSIRIACDARTNSLVVIAAPDQHEQIEDLIAGIDGE
jgi:hypothetical protein